MAGPADDARFPNGQDPPRRKPLEGATVTYEPEPFLGPSYHSHQGQTASNGAAVLNPECEGYPGIYVGLYRVRVSKVVGGKEIIPMRYNVKTVLGSERLHVFPPRTAMAFLN